MYCRFELMSARTKTITPIGAAAGAPILPRRKSRFQSRLRGKCGGLGNLHLQFEQRPKPVTNRSPGSTEASSGKGQDPEGLGVLDADLLPALLSLQGEPLFEEPEHVSFDLAPVLEQRLQLDVQEAGDVVVLV